MDLINNHTPSVTIRNRLAVEHRRIFAPVDDWTYSHHASPAFSRDRFVAISMGANCSGGSKHEGPN